MRKKPVRPLVSTTSSIIIIRALIKLWIILKSAKHLEPEFMIGESQIRALWLKAYMAMAVQAIVVPLQPVHMHGE